MPPRRDLRIPGGARPAGYSMMNHGQTQDTRSSGRFLIKPGADVDHWKPSWQGKETVVRVLPPVYTNEEGNKEIGGFRYTNERNDFQDWIRIYPAVRSFGVNNGITMLLNDSSTNPNYDVATNPASLLQSSVYFACKKGEGKPEWFPLTVGSQGKGAPLSRPTYVALTQAAIYVHSDKHMFVPGKTYPKGLGLHDKTVLFEIPPSAYKKLVSMWEERNKGFDTDSEEQNWEDVYVHGDPVDIASGRFVHFFEVGRDPRARFGGYQVASPTGGLPMPDGSAVGQGGDAAAKGYDAFMTKTFLGYPEDTGSFTASLLGWEEVIKARWKPWGDILQFYTEVEQAHIIAKLFPPSAILYAFRDRPDWIPDDVRGAAVERQTFGYDPNVMMTPPAAPTNFPPPPTQQAPMQARKETIPVRPGSLASQQAQKTPTTPPGLAPPPTDISVPTGVIPDDVPTEAPKKPSAALDAIKKRKAATVKAE